MHSALKKKSLWVEGDVGRASNQTLPELGNRDDNHAVIFEAVDVLAWGFKFGRCFPQDLCSSSETTKPEECRLRVPQMRKLKKQTSKQANDPQGWLKAQERLDWETGLCVSLWCLWWWRPPQVLSMFTVYWIFFGHRKKIWPLQLYTKIKGDGMKEPGVRMETMTAVQAREVL